MIEAYKERYDDSIKDFFDFYKEKEDIIQKHDNEMGVFDGKNNDLRKDIVQIENIINMIRTKYIPLDELGKKIISNYNHLLPPKYILDEYALSYFIQYIYYKQATTIGECLNLYEHRELQEEIIGQLTNLRNSIENLREAVVAQLEKINMKLDTMVDDLDSIRTDVQDVSSMSYDICNIRHNMGQIIDGQSNLIDSMNDVNDKVSRNNSLINKSNEIARNANSLINEGNKIQADSYGQLKEQYNETQKLYKTTVSLKDECVDFIEKLKQEKRFEGKNYF